MPQFYCPNCQKLFQSEMLKCEICKAEYDRQKLLKEGNFFLYLPVEKQLRDFLENQISNDLEYRFNRDNSNNVISDIYDAQMYKSLGDGILASDRDAEFVFKL